MNMDKIKYVDLSKENEVIFSELTNKIGQVIKKGTYILGDEVEEFEHKFASLCDSKYAVGVSNGTVSLCIILKCLGIGEGDEVITAPNSFLASASAIALVGAKPVFADVCDDFNIDPNKIETVITKRTKAIIPVHLTGRPANMNSIMLIAKKYSLYVIEDAAQAFGSKYHGKPVGSFGIANSFSLHPLKNLNACGDAGIITTNDYEIYKNILKYRNHGLQDRNSSSFWGYNARLDTIQAAILLVKMNHFQTWIEQKRKNSEYFSSLLKKLVKVPIEKDYEYNTYHTYIIVSEYRNELQLHLENDEIESKIHYPVCIHLQECARDLGYKRGSFPIAEKQSETILTLPNRFSLTESEKERIVESVLSFYKTRI